MKKLFTITVLLGVIIVLTPACSKEKTFPKTNPQAAFSSSSDTAFINDTVHFKNESLNAPTYLWQFGDGESSTAIFPSHVYKEAGTYTITLTAYSADGTRSDEENRDMEILAFPAASFKMSSDEVYIDETVSFTNTSTHASSYKWDFGDGKTSTDFEPTHIYTTAGNYTVTLTAMSGSRSDTHAEEIKVMEATSDPVAKFTYSPSTVYVNDVVHFTNTSTNASSYKWEFGDGQTSTETSPTHIYSNAGNYRVKLTAYSADGTKSDEQTENIKVNNQGTTDPIASFTYSPTTVYVNDVVHFTNTSANAGSYSWDFGDGQTSTQTTPTHTYANSGSYTVTLTAYSPDGTKSDTETKTIQVKKLPVANFTYSPTTVYVNDVVTFTNTSANAGSYSWDFGDGQTSTQTSPTHTYTNSGSYTVTLTAYSPDGTKSDTETKTIQVKKLPVAGFTYSPTTVYVNDVVHFTNTSANAGSYSWNFGDGQTSTQTTPTHTYANSGAYTVTLTAYSPDGTKSDTETKTIQVKKLPVAGFTYSPTTVYVNDVVHFTNTSANAGSYSWDFGDGQTSTQTSPNHTYTSSGSYTVTLKAYSPDGTKSDTETKTIQVKKLPVAGFTYSPTTVFVNDVVHFTNTSANAGSYSWNFGDGQTSTQTSPTHTYANSGSYTVTLTAYSPDGTKSDEATASIQVNDWGSNLTIQVNGVSFTMIYVEGGTFWMGAQSTNPNGQNYDPEAQSDEGPVHQVTLSSYYIGEFEVTQALWQAVMNNNPSYFTGNLQRPVEQVSWNDIVNNFIPALNAATGRTFALPTEAQWEFAARGGNGSQHYTYSGSNTVGNVAWYADNSGSQTHPVGQKQDNELDTYDMSGNVWEWCSDWYGSYSSGSQTNPQGPATGSYRVLRGGSWSDSASSCRVSNRYDDGPVNHYSNVGFRLVLFP